MHTQENNLITEYFKIILNIQYIFILFTKLMTLLIFFNFKLFLKLFFHRVYSYNNIN